MCDYSFVACQVLDLKHLLLRNQSVSVLMNRFCGHLYRYCLEELHSDFLDLTTKKLCLTMMYIVYQENHKLRQDMVTMEKAITERMGYLERHKVVHEGFCLCTVFMSRSQRFSI